MMCDSSCIDSVLQNAHRDVANDQAQKTSHSHKTGVSEVIIVHFNVDSSEAGISKSTVICPTIWTVPPMYDDFIAHS